MADTSEFLKQGERRTVAYSESFGALHQMLAGLSEQERTDTWREIEEALKAFEGPDGFAGPCELLVGAGTH